MGKKKLAKTALSAALVGSMILGNAASVYFSDLHHWNRFQ